MIQTMRKGKFGREIEICEGGPYPLMDLDGGGGSKSAVTPVIKLKNS